jgi:hypothetical protein
MRKFLRLFAVLLSLILFTATAANARGTGGGGGDRGGGGGGEPATIGYVGCSNSAASVDGYHMVGGTEMWPFIRNYGGGTIHVWASEIATGGQHWSAFTRQLQLQPVSVFWFQLCPREDELGGDNLGDAEAVIAELQRRVPDATIYVSALNDFEEPCPICGPDGPAVTRDIRDQLVAEGSALLGPDMGTLLVSQVNPQDGCHPNTSGRESLGDALLTFFG